MSRGIFAHVLRAFLILFCGAIGLHAQLVTYTWTGLSGNEGSNNWYEPNNWQGRVVPPEDLVNTQILFGSAPRTFVSFYEIYVNRLTFSGNIPSYELQGNADTAHIGSGGIIYSPTTPMKSVISGEVRLEAPQTWNIGNGTLVIDAYMSDGYSGYQLNKTGAGTLVFNNTYSGSWTGGLKLSQGNVVIAPGYYPSINPLGDGTLTFNGGTLVAKDNEYYDNSSIELSNNVVSNGLISTKNEVDLHIGFNGEGFSTIDLAGNTAVNSSGKPLFLEGNITESVVGSKLTVNGPGTVILTGANNYTGGTTASNGVLIFGNDYSIPDTGAITVAASGYAGIGSPGGQAKFFSKMTPAGVLGTVGFDSDPESSTNTFSGPIDLTNFGTTARLGSATTAILDSAAIITPQGTSYRFGGGGGELRVDSPLTGARNVVVDSPVAYPLTLRLTNSGNNYTLGTSITNSALIFGSDGSGNPAFPAGTGNITINTGGYVGFEFWVDQTDAAFVAAALAKINPASVGAFGFDQYSLITEPINLGSFTNALYLGTATWAGMGAGLTLSGEITPAGGPTAPYRFAGYKGGALAVASTLTGANGVLIGDPTSPATFGDPVQEQYSTVALTGNNSGLTGNVTLYGGQLLVGQSNGTLGSDPTNALGSGTLVVQGMTLPAEWQDDGEPPAPQLGTTTAGVIIPNNVTLNTDLNIAESSNLTLAGKISGAGELYLEGGDSEFRTSLTLTNDTNDFAGGIYLSGYSRFDVSANHATGPGPLGFGYSSTAEVYFNTTAPVIHGLMSKEDGDSATLYATATNTVLTIDQSFESQFNGYFRSNGPYPADNLRIVKSGAGLLRLNNGGMNFYHGTTEATLAGTPEVSLQVNQGTLVLGTNFYIESSAPTFWVHGGTLALDGAYFYNPVVIDNGGQLTGSGTIGGAVSLASDYSFGQAGMPSNLRLTGGLNATTAGTTVTVAGGALWLAGETGPNIGTIAVNANAAVVFNGGLALPVTAITAATGSYVGMGAGFLTASSFANLSAKVTPAAFAGTLGIDNYNGEGTYYNTGDLNLSGFTHANFAGLGSISDGLIESSAVITAPANGNLQLSGIDGGYLQVEAPLLTANGVTQVTIGRTDGHGDGGGVSLANSTSNYAGGTNVVSGTLVLGTDSVINYPEVGPGVLVSGPVGLGQLTLHGKVALETPGADSSFTLLNSIALPDANPATIRLGSDDYLYLDGQITGPGSLEARRVDLGNYGRLYLGGDNVNWSGGLKVKDDAEVYVESPTALGTGGLSFGTTPLNSYAYPEVVFTTPTATIYGLSGGFNDNSDGYYASLVTLSGTVLTINQAANTEFKGSIGGMGSITKTGPGTLVLSGVNNYPGPTTISAGTLQFARQDAFYDNSFTSTNLIVTADATAAFNVGGPDSGLFTTDNIATLAAFGTATDGFLSGSYLGLDTTHATAGNFTYGGIIANPNAGANVLGLIKLGTGTLTLSAANTYTGKTKVNAGTLSVGVDQALPVVTELSLAPSATLDVANNQTVATLFSDSPSSSVVIAGGKSFTVSGAITTDYLGLVSGDGALVKAGTGTLNLTGAATHTGGTTINAGTLSIGNGGNTGSLTGNVSVTTPGNLAFNRFDAVTFAGIVSGTGSLTKAGSGTLTLTGANTYSGGTTVANGTLVGNATSLQGAIANHANLGFDQASAGTYAGIISGAGNLTKLGAGNLTLGGNNTYTGSTTVSGGTLTLGVANALPVTTQLLLTNGSVLAVNSNQTIAGFFGASDPASLLQLAGVTFTVAMPVANVSTTFAGSVTGTGTFAVSGAGNDIVNLTGNIASTIATQIGTGATLIIGTGGSLTGPITTNGTLSFDNPGIQTISGVISGTGGLLATAGLTTLSGANTYSGGTVINGGTLLVANLSGSGTGSGPVTVGSGGVFGGTGSISGPMTINTGGTVSPGASPGILTVGATTFAGGGHFKFEINDTTGTPGTQWDLLSISGALAINATPGAPFILDLASLTAANATGLLANFDNTKTYSWQFVTATGLITGFDPGAFQYNASLFQNSLGNLGGHFFVSQSGSTLSLNFTPVPEPSTYALLALGLGLLGLTAWRRRRAS